MSEKKNVITGEDLHGILEERISVLEARVKEKFKTKPGRQRTIDNLRPALGVVSELRKDIKARIARIPELGIRDKGALAVFCKKIENCVSVASQKVQRATDKRFGSMTDVKAFIEEEFSLAREKIKEGFELPEVLEEINDGKNDGENESEIEELEGEPLRAAFMSTVKNEFDKHLLTCLEALLEETLLKEELSEETLTALCEVFQNLHDELIRCLHSETAGKNLAELKTCAVRCLNEPIAVEVWSSLSEEVQTIVKGWLIELLIAEIAKISQRTLSKQTVSTEFEITENSILGKLRPEDRRASLEYSFSEKELLGREALWVECKDFGALARRLNQDFHGGAAVRNAESIAHYLEENGQDLLFEIEPDYSTEEDEFLGEALRMISEDCEACDDLLKDDSMLTDAEGWASHLNAEFHQGKKVRTGRDVLKYCRGDLFYKVFDIDEEPVDLEEDDTSIESGLDPKISEEIDRLLAKVKEIKGPRHKEAKQSAVRKLLDSFVLFFQRYKSTATGAQLKVIVNLLRKVVDDNLIIARTDGAIEMPGTAGDLAEAFMSAVEDLSLNTKDTPKEMNGIMDHLQMMTSGIEAMNEQLAVLEAEGWAQRDGELNGEIAELKSKITEISGQIELLKAQFETKKSTIRTLEPASDEWEELAYEISGLKHDQIPNKEKLLTPLELELAIKLEEKSKVDEKVDEILRLEGLREELERKKFELLFALNTAFSAWKQANQ